MDWIALLIAAAIFGIARWFYSPYRQPRGYLGPALPITPDTAPVLDSALRLEFAAALAARDDARIARVLAVQKTLSILTTEMSR